MIADPATTEWRVDDLFLATNASKAGLLDETRQFLLEYGRLGSVEAAWQELVGGGLPQRSRETRVTILRVLQARLTRWYPPSWVLDDLVRFATDNSALRAALLLHVPRQDAVLYALVQEVVWPRWRGAEREITRADVQRYFDSVSGEHPELERWSHETREKLAGNLLTILRDYGLLKGSARKVIVEPVVPTEAAQHLARLLRAEGVDEQEVPNHPDWRLWLWDPSRVRMALEGSP